MTKLQEPKDILLIEDTASHRDLILEALESVPLLHKVHLVSNGEEALYFLYQKENYAQARRPSLILLDLNMPRMDGCELLATIKQHSELKLIPVVVFTTSTAQEDVLKCYRLYANCYITKPSDLDQFFQVVTGIVDFWFNIVTLPGT